MQWMARFAQPESMKTGRYQYGVETVDGNDAWALFCASGAGDAAQVGALLERDPRLVNAQHWYQFPIHMAVREGRAEVVELLLRAGGRSRTVAIHLQLVGQAAGCRGRPRLQ